MCDPDDDALEPTDDDLFWDEVDRAYAARKEDW